MKYSVRAGVLLSALFFLNACATWSGVKHDSAVAWEGTKSVSKDVWSGGKKVVHDVTDQ